MIVTRVAAARLGEARWAALAAGCASPERVARYRAKVVQVIGSDCGSCPGKGSGPRRGRLRLAPGELLRTDPRWHRCTVHRAPRPPPRIDAGGGAIARHFDRQRSSFAVVIQRLA